jgi:hypothetical protein
MRENDASAACLLPHPSKQASRRARPYFRVAFFVAALELDVLEEAARLTSCPGLSGFGLPSGFLLLNDLVTLAGSRLKLGLVYDGYVSTGVRNYSRLLQYAGRYADG